MRPVESLDTKNIFLGGSGLDVVNGGNVVEFDLANVK